MKRFFPIILTLMLILTLAIAGCGGGNSGGNPDGNPDGGTGTKYIVTFNSNGGSAVASQEVSSGGLVTRPADPTKSGLTFGGWYKEAGLTTAWNFANDTVTSNITLYAKWSGGGTLTGYVSIYTDATLDVNANNVKIEISNNDTIIAFTHTDASGNYSISNIPAGNYTVKADFENATPPPPALYTRVAGGAFRINDNPSWTSARGWSIGETYNNTVIGTEINAISISNGVNTTIIFRLQVDAP